MSLVGKKFRYKDAIVTIREEKKDLISFWYQGNLRNYMKDIVLSKGMLQPIDIKEFIPNCTLEYKEEYGTNSRDIYKFLVDNFGFDINAIERFGPFTKLHALAVSPENYSVWFLAYNNLNGLGNDEKWKNTIADLDETIYEKWITDESIRSLGDVGEYRLTFVSKRDSNNLLVYKFFGVFECIDIDDNKRIKTYKRVSKTYPITKDVI